MKYDAVNVTDRDLQAGLPIIRQFTHFPWVSACFYDEEQNPLFSKDLIVSRGNLRIGITGVSEAPSPPDSLQNVSFRDWSSVLPEIVKSLESSSDFIILLSSLSYAQNIKIASQFPSIRLIVMADHNRGVLYPKLHHNSVITQTNSRGKSLGQLKIESPFLTQWENDNTQQIKYLTRSIKRWDEKIVQLEESKDNQSDNKKRLLQQYNVKKNLYQTKLDSLESQSDTSPKSSYISKTHIIKKSTPKEEEIERIISETKTEIREANSKRIKSKNPQELAQISKLFLSLSGSDKCFSCHESHFSFWQKTRHAKAFGTLTQKDEDKNIECLRCHVTLDNSKFTDNAISNETLLFLPKKLNNVGCESCHGSAIEHIDSPSADNIKKVVSEEICLQCHTEERDDSFNYAAKKEKITCPAE